MAYIKLNDKVLSKEYCPKSENSVGTKLEIEKAKELGIPVYYSVSDFHKWMTVELHELIGE